MKHRIVHFLQKYLLNPQIKILFAIGIVLPGYALLETTGRKTGRPRRTPVGDGRVGSQFWLIVEHGMRAGYVRNIASDPRVRLKLRSGISAAGIRVPLICCLKMIHGRGRNGFTKSCRVVSRMLWSFA
jgi:hypothetical protein